MQLLAAKTYKFKHARWGEFTGQIEEKRGDFVTIKIIAGTVTYAGGKLKGPGKFVTMHVQNIEGAVEV